MIVRVIGPVSIKSGGWRTVQSLWNVKATAFFRSPAGARIKVRYGVGVFGKDRQVQTLDSQTYKKLTVGAWSVMRARLQVRVDRDADIMFELHIGSVAVTSPSIGF